VVSQDLVSIEFKPVDAGSRGECHQPEIVTVPLFIHSRHPKREIIEGNDPSQPEAVGMRSDTRKTLLVGIAKARPWAKELVEGRVGGAEEIAKREGCSARHVRRTIQLAFLAPDIISAILANSVPPDFGISRLSGDLPYSWKQQRRLLQN